MFGKLVCAVVCVVGCAHNVNQDKATGEDGKQKGAREMVFENGEARSEGIVTYPGGDRADWKVLELPDKKTGTLELTLTWKVPRPNLQLAFDVYDAYGYEVGATKKTTKKKARGRKKETKLELAKGKYFVRVFAVGRGDAGKYELVANFTEASVEAGLNEYFLAQQVNDPPKLAAVPEAEVPCDEFAFDPKNKACASVCPKSGAPPGWPACTGVCPTPPDVNNPVCHATMPCPMPMDRRVKDCKGKFPKCPDPKNPDPANPNCDNANVDPVTARVVKQEVQGDGVVITVASGSAQGIGKGWKGTVLRGDSDQPLPGGDVVVVRIDKNVVIARVKLTSDQVTANPRVKFSPPPRAQ